MVRRVKRVKNITIDALSTANIIASNITTSNLNVIGDTTILNTTFYQTEQLEVFSDTNATSMKVTQNNNNNNVAEFYNNNHLSFVIDKNSNIGIGGITTPDGLLHLNKTTNADVTIRLSDATNASGVVIKKDSNQDFIIKNTHSNGDIMIGVSGKDKTLVITPQISCST